MADTFEDLGRGAVAMATPQTPSRSRFALRSPREALQPVNAPAPPPRRKRRSGFLGRISGILSLLVFLSVVVGGAAMYVSTEVNSPGPLTADKIVLIPKNSTGGEIVEQLAREGVIDHPSLMSAWVVLKQPKLRAGEYIFKKASSIVDVVKTIDSGKTVVYKFTVPEGLTSEQIVDRLNDNDVLSGDIRDVPREGTLLPDTYQFERGYPRERILKDMKAAQEKMVKDIWARRSPDVPIRTPNELITLASIVEKETGKAEERPRVAAVFINRLNRDMRLQTDPTVIYGIVGGRGSLGRGLTRAELDTPTPYNTYTIKGLPPGPIANPGKAALEAVANPLKTNELYFVADGTGGHAFAETRAQHERNVARWRQIENVPKETSAPQLQPVAPPLQAPAGTPPIGLTPQTRTLTPSIGSPPPPSNGTRSSLPLPRAPLFAANPSFNLPRTNFDLAPLPSVNIPGVTDSAASDTEASGLASENFTDRDAVGGPVESYPVPAYRRTGNHSVAASQDDARSAAPALAYQSPAAADGPPRSRAFDAVEGTDKDPLRNKTFDLNSPKTVPTLR